MIHTLLNLTRPLFVTDTETTGLNTDTARILELGFQQWTAEGLVKEWRTYINPLVPIPAVVTEVHGITDEFIRAACRHCQQVHDGGTLYDHEWAPLPTFKQLAPSLAKGFTDCDYAGKNVRYDLRITAAEMKRAGQAWSYAGARIVDADRLEQLAVPRHLSDLHKKYTGSEHDGAHGALSDVRASMTVIAKQLETYETLPRDLDKIHELSWPGWLTADGGFRMVNGVPTIMFGKHRDTAMRDVPRGYWDWMLSADFAADARKLAAEAKMGKFPEVK